MTSTDTAATTETVIATGTGAATNGKSPPRRKPTGRIAPMVLATEAKASDTVIALVQPQPFTEVSSLAQRANEAHARASAAALNVVEHAIAAGAALIEARKLVAHRDWLRWVGKRDFSP